MVFASVPPYLPIRRCYAGKTVVHLSLPKGRLSGVPVLATLVGVFLSSSASAGDALVAVAANFSEAAEHLATHFEDTSEDTSEHTLTITTGSTGKLYAQIRHGAPFDILLAADQHRPRLLETTSQAVAGSRFTYAIGRLTLWSPDPNCISAAGPEILRAGAFDKIAIANPDLAPYGAAARETLKVLGLFDILRHRIVMGENIGQAHALVATGNADAGFVALSHVLSPRNRQKGSRWDVPQHFYTPIRQDAVLLNRGSNNPAAHAFLDYLKSKESRGVIESFGYAVD